MASRPQRSKNNNRHGGSSNRRRGARYDDSREQSLKTPRRHKGETQTSSIDLD